MNIIDDAPGNSACSEGRLRLAGGVGVELKWTMEAEYRAAQPHINAFEASCDGILGWEI